jgi:hypothetical protein
MATRFYVTIVESSGSSNRMVVDRENGIIRGVKVLGLISDNGRQYLPSAVKAAQKMYEGIKVNIDHPAHADDSRSATDRFGKLINIHFVEGEGLYGDLEFLTTHPMAARICEAAERMPDAFGLSHNAQGEGDEKDGIFVVSKIVEVRHVDVVADPATTKSLSESIKKEPAMEPEKKMEADMMAPEPKKTMEADNAEFGAKAAEIIGGEGDTSTKVKALVELVHAMYGAESDKTAVDEEEEIPVEDPSEEVEKKAMEGDGYEVDAKKKDEKSDKKSMESRSYVAKLVHEAGITLTESLVSDLALLPKEAAQRQVRRIALAQKSSKPKSSGYIAPISESKIPAGSDMFAWLRS